MSLSACGGGGGGGDSPTRYNPGPVATPTGVVVLAGDGEVALSWPAAQNASAYNIYWSTSPAVDKSSSSVRQTTGTSIIVTGLTNGTTYYFAVTAVAAYTETPLSAVVSAQPVVTELGLVDLNNNCGPNNCVWDFNILVSGQLPGWMQGQVTIDSNGAVTFVDNTFLDSSGNTVPPADLFATWSVLPDGAVSQTGSATNFVGALANNAYRDILVGTAQWRGSSDLIAIFQKQVSSVAFGNGDIEGYGSSGGPRYFVYNQISSGTVQEWEFGLGQIGGTAISTGSQYFPVKYVAVASSDVGSSTFPSEATTNLQATPKFTGSGNASKSSALWVDPTGTVTEVPDPGVNFPPAIYFQGIMSADKTVIVGTFSGPVAGEYALRIYQIVNITTTDLTTGINYDLAKPYNFEKLAVGSTALSAYGTMLPLSATPNATSGTIGFSSYSDTIGGNTPAAAYFAYFTALGPGSQGAILYNPGNGGYPADSTFYGKVSYYSDLVVSTRTEPNGTNSLTIGIQQP